jgi:hypothetical protein
LILFGAFLLVLNLRPDWISFRMVATYWPFLLIAWGLLRLVEVVYWYFSAGETPRRGMGGGEWFLVVLICLAGSGLFFFHNRAPELPRVFVGDRTIELFGEVYDFPIAEAQSTAKVSRVVVDNPRGSTRIIGADAEGVRLGGRKSIRAFSQNDAEAASRRTRSNLPRKRSVGDPRHAGPRLAGRPPDLDRSGDHRAQGRERSGHRAAGRHRHHRRERQSRRYQ